MLHVIPRYACLLFFLVTCWSRAVPAEDSKKLSDIRTRMQEFVDKGEIAGAVTLVGRRGGIIHHEAVGYQNLEGQISMRKDTLFRIASMTKPITALGIMLLVDE